MLICSNSLGMLGVLLSLHFFFAHTNIAEANSYKTLLYEAKNFYVAGVDSKSQKRYAEALRAFATSAQKMNLTTALKLSSPQHAKVRKIRITLWKFIQESLTRLQQPQNHMSILRLLSQEIATARKKIYSPREKKVLTVLQLRLWVLMARIHRTRKEHWSTYQLSRRITKLQIPTGTVITFKRIKQQAMGWMKQAKPKIQVEVRVISSPKGGTVQITDSEGNKVTGRTPYVGRVAPGKLSLVLSMIGFHPKKEAMRGAPGAKIVFSHTFQKKQKPRVFVAQVKRTKPFVQLKHPSVKTSRPMTIGAYTTLGLGVAFGVIGGAFLAVAAEKLHQGVGNPDPTKGKQLLQEESTFRTLAIVSFVAAAPTLVTSITFFVLRKRNVTTTSQTKWPGPTRTQKSIVLYSMSENQ